MSVIITWVKRILIVTIVIPILMIGFGMYLDNWCASTITNESWKQTQDQICGISYNFIEQNQSPINP